MHHRGRLLFGAILVLVVACGLVIRYRLTGPRLTLVAVMRSPVEHNKCLREIRSYGSGQGSEMCTASPGTQWFHATVTNGGGRGAWVSTCYVLAYDATRKYLTSADVPMWITQGGVGDRPFLAPGQSASLDWFIPTQVSGKVASLDGSCDYVVYRHPPI